MLACVVALLGIGAPAASAAPEAGPGWSFRSSFGSFQSELFDTPRNSVDVDGNGNVFAVEQQQISVHAFSPSGGLLTTPVGIGLGIFSRNIAVDPGDGTLYVDEMSCCGSGLVRRLVSDGQPTPTYTVDSGFNVPQGDGIAVDASTHDLLVAAPAAEAVRRYDTTGALVDTVATPGINPAWIATAPDGSFFVAPADGPDVTHFSGAGAQLGMVSGVGQMHSLTFDSVRSLVVLSVGDTIKTYSVAGSLLSESAAKGSNGIGLAVDGVSGVLYEHGRNTVRAYDPATIPGLQAPVVSDIAADSVHLSAEVDPGAGPPDGSAARFEYSEDGGVHWTALPDETLTGPDTIEADLTGLTLNWGFLARVKAFNSLASKTSAAVSFSTPEISPVVETGAASDRSETGAVLHGTVNPAGLQTTYHFEYGTTTAYGGRVPLVTGSPAGNHRTPRSASAAIDGLQPGTTYHYRLVAENEIGETVGADMTFSTITALEAFPQRAYEQVTPVDKGGAQVASEFHTQIDPGGSWIAVATASGSTEDEGVMMRPNYLVRRGTDGWSDWMPTEAPQSAAPGIFESGTTGISADGSHALVVSNRALAPGGIDGGGNLYDKDLRTGSYTFVGGAPGASAYNQMANGIENEEIFAAAAPDFSWILFWAKPALLPEASGSALYRWTRDGGLSIESWIPDFFDPSSEVVAPFIQNPTQSVLTLPSSTQDGDIVAFGAAETVYRRANGVTKAVSVSHIPGDPSFPQAAQFNGMSSDGRYVFLQSRVRLTEDTPIFGVDEHSFYRYDAATEDLIFLALGSNSSVANIGISADGTTTYIQKQSSVVVWRNGVLQTVANENIANSDFHLQTYITENGRYFAFISADGEAHLYDAGTDQNVCVSCPTDGSPRKRGQIMGIPARTIGNTLPRVVTEDGMVFFGTAAPQVAADHNGSRDVYAYKNGRYALISPGDGNFEATFIGASDDGRDVYFQTDQGLVSRDVDGNTDVYDARIGGGFASQNQPSPSPPCVRGGCDETASGPVASPPVSSQTVTANTAQALKKCRKGYVRKSVIGKQRCVKTPKHRKKASNKRSVKRSRATGK